MLKNSIKEDRIEGFEHEKPNHMPPEYTVNDTVLKEILATRFLKGKLNCQGGSEYTQNVALAA